VKPYYADEAVTLYHGDCREVTAWLEADVLVTDPPYGMAFKQGRRVNGQSSAWTSRWTDVTIAGDDSTEARDGALAAWGDDRPALVFGTWKRPAPAGVREVLVWDKVVSTGMGALDVPWRPSWESIYVIGKGFTGRRSHGVLSVSMPTLDPARKDHPTAKPVDLMVRLIDKTVGTVADPFAGSGSTLVAAKQLGRKAIGVELEERYCEIIAKRLAQGVLDFGEAVS
jgi:site-specific DNA-methyltransferase (adenine-specific)